MKVTIESDKPVIVTQRQDAGGRTIVTVGSQTPVTSPSQSRSSSGWPWWVLPAAVATACWVIWSLPVIAHAEWFPLDFSALITLDTDWQRNPWRFLSPYAIGSGRYFPFYWLIFGIQSYLFGTTTWLYSLTLGAVLLAAMCAMAGMVYRTTRRLDASLALLPLLYLGTPVAENVSTIGKAEPYLCLLLFSAIAIFLHQCCAPASRGAAVARYVLIGAAFAMAMWTKETSVALLGFCMAGLTLAVGGWLYLKAGGWRDCAQDYVRLLQSLLCGLAVAKAPYFLFKDTLHATNYTDYALTWQLVANNGYFYVTQQPDVLAFGLLSAVLIGIIGWHLAKQPSADRTTAHAFLLFAAMISMGWAYYAALLIWRWPMSYYMLLPSCVFRAATVYGVIQIGLLADWRWPRRLAAAAIAIATLYGAAYAWYVIGSQIEYSRMYARMLEQACNRVPANGRLYFESYPFYAEQVYGTHMWLEAFGRKDIAVGGIADYLDPAVPSPEICKLLNVTDAALKENRKRIPAHGDHLVVFTGDKLATWMLRGVTPYYCQQSLLTGPQGDFDLELLAEQQAGQYSLYPHVWTGALTARHTTLGYKLYKVTSDKPRRLWFDRHPDGWVGTHATITINSPSPTTAMVRVSAPPFTLPNHVTITCDGRPPVNVPLVDTNEVIVPVACDCTDGTSTIELHVARVVSPKSLKINRDKRLLGIRAACELAPVAPKDTVAPAQRN